MLAFPGKSPVTGYEGVEMKLTIFAAAEGIDGKCYVRLSRRATKSWRGADVPRPKWGAFRIRLFVVPAATG